MNFIVITLFLGAAFLAVIMAIKSAENNALRIHALMRGKYSRFKWVRMIFGVVFNHFFVFILCWAFFYILTMIFFLKDEHSLYVISLSTLLSVILLVRSMYRPN